MVAWAVIIPIALWALDKLSKGSASGGDSITKGLAGMVDSTNKAVDLIKQGSDKAQSYNEPYLNPDAFRKLSELVQSGQFQKPFNKSFTSQSYNTPAFNFDPNQGRMNNTPWQPSGPATYTPQNPLSANFFTPPAALPKPPGPPGIPPVPGQPPPGVNLNAPLFRPNQSMQPPPTPGYMPGSPNYTGFGPPVNNVPGVTDPNIIARNPNAPITLADIIKVLQQRGSGPFMPTGGPQGTTPPGGVGGGDYA